MEIKSLRVQDSMKEKAVANFLDDKLYSRQEFSNVIRVNEKQEQLNGVDLTCDYGESANLIIDEKAQVHYIDKNLPTFAFEIDFFTSKQELVQGWLFDKNKKTTHYLLVWVWTKEGFLTKKEDIKKLECLLLERNKIIDFLQERGITEKSATLLSTLIRNQRGEKTYLKEKLNGCYFYFSEHLVEEPVNIIIRKEELKKISKEIFELT